MSEDYNELLAANKSLLKKEIGSLEVYKERLQKEINQFKNDRQVVEKDFEVFIGQQIKFRGVTLKEVCKEVDDEIARNIDKIAAINELGRQVKSDLEKLDERKVESEKKEKDLEVRQKEFLSDQDNLSAKTQILNEIFEGVEKDSGEIKDNKEVIEKFLGEIVELLARIKKYSVEKQTVLSEKEQIVNDTYKRLVVARELVDNSKAWVEDQKVSIKSQWTKLLSAKNSLKNGERN